MKHTLSTLRLLGIAAGLWLLISAGVGLSREISAFSPFIPSSSASDPHSFLFAAFTPVLAVALLLLLPWSRIRPSAIWWPLFVLFASATVLWMRQLLLPYVTLWRPDVLWEQSILQPILFYATFLTIQLAAIFALRHLPLHAYSQSNRTA